MLQESFYQIKIGNVIEIGVVVVGAVGLLLQRREDARKERETREHEIEEQVKMHTENKERLEILLEFRKDQEILNDKRDQQVQVLTNLATTQTELAKGLNRRLEMIENIVHKQRS